MNLIGKSLSQLLMSALAVPGVAVPDAMQGAISGEPQLDRCETPIAPMVQIPVGMYRPFFKTATGANTVPGKKPAPIAIPAFKLDAAPVTRQEYLGFVCRHPQWRKSHVKGLFAEATYLADWPGDLDPDTQRLREPVTQVSWFAARAYCASRNARLATVIEWERVAGDSANDDADQRSRDPRMPFRFAMGRAAQDLKSLPLTFPGLWEWTADFNSALVASGGSAKGRTTGSLFCGDGYRATNARDYAAFLRHSFRSSLRANYTLKNLGFRCATGE